MIQQKRPIGPEEEEELFGEGACRSGQEADRDSGPRGVYARKQGIDGMEDFSLRCDDEARIPVPAGFDDSSHRFVGAEDELAHAVREEMGDGADRRRC